MKLSKTKAFYTLAFLQAAASRGGKMGRLARSHLWIVLARFDTIHMLYRKKKVCGSCREQCWCSDGPKKIHWLLFSSWTVKFNYYSWWTMILYNLSGLYFVRPGRHDMNSNYAWAGLGLYILLYISCRYNPKACMSSFFMGCVCPTQPICHL